MYDSAWALKRVEEFLDKWPRGTLNLGRFMHISRIQILEHASQALSRSQLKWTMFKYAVKFFDACDPAMVLELRGPPGKYYPFVKRFVTESALDELEGGDS